MNLLVRRRVLWDYLAGALWVLPTLSVVVFLAAGALLSRVSINADSPLWALAFQGTADDTRNVLIVVSTSMITVTGLIFALTIVALQIASGQYSPRLLRNFMRDRGTQVVLSVLVGAFAYSTAGLYTVGWHDPDLGRPIAAPLQRCAQLLGVDLATVRTLATNVEPYLRADGTRIWSVMQLERQLRPEAYGRRRGGYLHRRRTRTVDG